MTNAEILSHIDHTLLKPEASWQDIVQLCREAVAYGTASVCIPPCYVAPVRKEFPSLNVCTVIGFPLGYMQQSAKESEARAAVESGADEIDMVINVSALKSENDEAVLKEIQAIRGICGKRILKVIIETCLLTEQEKIRCCEMVTEAKADYIKTSTGFGKAGAVPEDILLFRTHIGEAVKIKAAGGIRTREQMEAFLSAGCDRIGTSAAGILFRES